MRHSRDEEDNDGSDLAETLPRARVKLDTLLRLRREMGRLYLEARDGRRPVGEAARLAFILTQMGRMIEGADLERRIEALEAKALEGRR